MAAQLGTSAPQPVAAMAGAGGRPLPHAPGAVPVSAMTTRQFAPPSGRGPGVPTMAGTGRSGPSAGTLVAIIVAVVLVAVCVGAGVAFLQQADAEQALHQPRDYGIRLFGSGLGGALVLLGLYSMAWGGRKRGSVNQKIFDRQVKST